MRETQKITRFLDQWYPKKELMDLLGHFVFHFDKCDIQVLLVRN